MVNTEIRLITFFAEKMEKFSTVSKTRPGGDCGSDHELLNSDLNSIKWSRGSLDHSGMT